MHRLCFKCLQEFDWRNDELKAIGVKLPIELVISNFCSNLALQKSGIKILAIEFFGVCCFQIMNVREQTDFPTYVVSSSIFDDFL